MAHRILVRGDDLGYSEAVNYGIAKAVREGIVRSVGVMPNMPSVEMGLELLRGADVCLGQHTNICAGYPLSDPERIPSLVRENGEFKPSRAYMRAFREGNEFVVLDEAILEIEAQYERYLELVGEKPRYFEAHAIASHTFAKALSMVAEREGLDLLPLPTDFSGPTTFRHTRLYMSMDSMKPGYDPYASFKRDALRDYGENAFCMFVMHPGYLDHYLLTHSSLTIPRTQEVAMACDPEIRAWMVENDVEVVSYDDLA